MRRPKTNRHLRTLLQLLGCCAAILCIWQVPKIGSNFVVYLVSRILFMGLMAMSMNLLMGFGGLTSLAQAGFAGISGYAFAICRATYKMIIFPVCSLLWAWCWRWPCCSASCPPAPAAPPS